MFVQMMEGRTRDAGALRRQLDAWVDELSAGARGWLGSTGGVTDDGRVFLTARFESADHAKANSDRAEQGRWWESTASCFDGDVSFTESEDVETFLAGGSNEAGFVQVITASADRDRLHAIDAVLEDQAASMRPDLIGGWRAWTGAQSYVEVAYFTSEEDARANESRDVPPEMADMMSTYQELMAGAEYIDLRDPWLL